MDRGFYIRAGVNTHIESGTVLDASQYGVTASKGTENVGLLSSTFTTNTLAIGTGTGFDHRAEDVWQVVSSNASGTAVAYDPDDANVIGSLEVDPQLGGCRLYIPESSAMKRAGQGGADIGANIIYRARDGALESERLWRPTGEFPCGPAIAGFTDDPTGATIATEACGNVHLRLGFDGSCPVP
jgi:hypothetical protein